MKDFKQLALKVIDQFPSHYPISRRKEMGLETVKRVRKEILLGKEYEGMDMTLSDLELIKKEINEL